MRTAIVTGANSGIGLATAIHLSKAGFKVYAGVRRPEAADQLDNAIAAESLSIIPLALDVRDDASVEAAVANVLGNDGQIDALINNAGIAGGHSVEETPIEFLREIFDTNFFGAVTVIRAVLPSMRRHRTGAIVNVTSISGRVATPNAGAYCSSKFALEGLSEALAAEVLPFGIRVSVVEPGTVATSIFKNSAARQPPLDPESAYAAHTRRKQVFFKSQLGRDDVLSPDHVAKVILETLTADAPKFRYVVGEDASALLKGRAAVPIEEFLGASAAADDEAYFDLMTRFCGRDLFKE